jgi:hypothetical protein
MRKILHDEFWQVVRERVSEDEYRKMVDAFRGEKTEKNIADVEDRFKRQGAIMSHAAALNGCDCPGDNEEYYSRIFKITRRVLGDELLTNPDVDLKNYFEVHQHIGEKLRAEVIELGREFDSRKQSHPTYDGYICYRDYKF